MSSLSSHWSCRLLWVCKLPLPRSKNPIQITYIAGGFPTPWLQCKWFNPLGNLQFIWLFYRYTKWTPGSPSKCDVWLTFHAVENNHTGCGNGSSCSGSTVAGLVFYAVFSYLWTSQVIGNVALATLAGGAYGSMFFLTSRLLPSSHTHTADWYYFGPRDQGQMVSVLLNAYLVSPIYWFHLYIDF